MKIYVLIFSRNFPKYHPKAGNQTYFVYNLNYSLNSPHYQSTFKPIYLKLHTVRANYALWKKRAEAINSGIACLSLRYWSGMPFQSKQIEFNRLYKIKVQAFLFIDEQDLVSIDGSSVRTDVLAHNDGLSLPDFIAWFPYKTSRPMALIQLTDFSY